METRLAIGEAFLRDIRGEKRNFAKSYLQIYFVKFVIFLIFYIQHFDNKSRVFLYETLRKKSTKFREKNVQIS